MYSRDSSICENCENKIVNYSQVLQLQNIRPTKVSAYTVCILVSYYILFTVLKNMTLYHMYLGSYLQYGTVHESVHMDA
jgi:hypothetical protein